MNQPLNPYVQPQQVAPQRNLGQLIASLGPQSNVLQQSTVDPRALAAGIKPAFASLTFKGKVWGIRHRGVTQQLLARDPQTGAIIGAIPTVDIIILKSATAISKNYYIGKYQEGDFNQPDCWSTNGQVPDPAAPKKQSNTCRGCPHDAFGSRTMDDGRKGKACSDSKRVCVVPAADIKNEAFGGPMLLKLPPSSFAGLSELENQLHMQGYSYFGLVMRLSFDHQAAFPKIIFTPVRVLNDYEAQAVLEMQQVDTVERILNEELYEVTGDPQQPIAEAAQPAGIPPNAPTHYPHAHPQGPVHNPPPQPTPVVAQQPAPTAFTPQPPPPPGPAPSVSTVAATAAFGGAVHQPAPVHAPPLDPNLTALAGLPQQLDLTIPPHLKGPAPGNPYVTPPPQSPPVTQSPPAAHQAPQVTNGAAQALTPEQQEIERLKAELAKATAPKPRKPRSTPVTPTGAVTVQPAATAAPAEPALPFTAHAGPPQAASPANPETPADETDDGDAPANLQDRINSLLGGGNPT